MAIGKGFEGYWTSSNIIEQIPIAVKASEAAHGPDFEAVFVFDNSPGHSVYAPDALRTAQMNKGRKMERKEKKVPMRDGWYFRFNSAGGVEKVTQKMNDENGEPKGMQLVLHERGLLHNWDLRARCKDEHSANGNCCMEMLLGSQPDFVHQAKYPWIREVVESLGHKCILLPKFHCELNIIEYFWGASKRYTREHCRYNWDGLQATVPATLGSVELSTIRRWETRFWRTIEEYRDGSHGTEKNSTTGETAKKYASHRRVGYLRRIYSNLT